MEGFRRYLVASFTIVFLSFALIAKDFNAQVMTFNDVNEDSYYYEGVRSLSNRGIINGYQDNTFKPNQYVTRGHAAKILTKALNLNTTIVDDPGFTDITPKHPYYKEIAALANAGIIQGKDNNTFQPNDPLTRAQMAKMIIEGFDFQLESIINSPFVDVKADAWYADYIHTLFSNKITTGVTTTTFEPNRYVTRGQLVTFIIRSEKHFISDNSSPTHKTTSPRMIAGNREYGYRDGLELDAMFRTPTSIITTNGAYFVSDSWNHVIRNVQGGNVSTYAGTILLTDDLGNPKGGLYDSSKEKSMFSNPSGLAVDGKGNIYVADSNNHVIRKILTNGQVMTLAGNGLPGNTDGTTNNASFYYPQDLAVTNDGTVFVADTLNHVIRKIDPAGNVTTLNVASNRSVEIIEGVIESAGDYKDGPINLSKFNEPSGLAIDKKGNLYVSDTGNQLIRYIDFETNTVSTVAGTYNINSNLYATGGYQDGKALEAKFNSPKGLALTGEGNLIIADSSNHAVRYLENGQVITIGSDFIFPTDVAVTDEGSIVVVDSYQNIIQEIKFDR